MLPLLMRQLAKYLAYFIPCLYFNEAGHLVKHPSSSPDHTFLFSREQLVKYLTSSPDHDSLFPREQLVKYPISSPDHVFVFPWEQLAKCPISSPDHGSLIPYRQLVKYLTSSPDNTLKHATIADFTSQRGYENRAASLADNKNTIQMLNNKFQIPKKTTPT